MTRKVMNGLDLQNQKITNLADGSANTDAVTFQQFQAGIRGLDWKASVRAATTANITLSGLQTIDGVVLSANDRVLVMAQTTTSNNGIYAAASGAWTRVADADENAEVTSGMAVSVEEGTVNGDKTYVLTTNNPITLGTTGLQFSVLGGGATYSAGNGITLTGSTFSVNPAASGGISVAAGGVSVDTAIVVRKFAANVGNGSSTALAVTHNLGTRDVTVAVFDNSTFEEILPDVIHTDTNTVTLNFAVAPASNAYRCVVHA